MKVAIDSGPLTSGHSVRGIGFMVGNQIRAIKEIGDKKIELDDFDFQSEEGKSKLQTEKYDVVHLTSFFPFALTLPAQKLGKKMVVTIPDLIPLIYPKQYPPGVKGNLNFLKQKQRLINADAIITISETSKKDIVRFLGIPTEKIHVVYLAAGDTFKPRKDKDVLRKTAKKYGLPKQFVLYLGDVNYNKNIPNLIKACLIADMPLVICGKHAKEVDDERLELKTMKGPQDWLRYITGKPHPEIAHYSELKKLFSGNNVLRLGYIPDEDLVAIFSLASAYCQPSFYEGFGLPVLQAFACGCPVVITRTQALVEIGDNAALYADPKDYKDIAKKIDKLFKNSALRQKMVGLGKERAKEFSWTKTANETIGVYEKVLGEK